MSIMFDPYSYFTSYDRNYVKNVYAQKQIQNQDVIVRNQENVAAPKDTYFISQPAANNLSYYTDMARDYIEGAITEEEYFNHLEDIYYSRGGWATEEVSLEERQNIFNWIAHEAYNGILDYYMIKNREEWDAVNATAASRVDFYYNTDYHYAELEQKEKSPKDKMHWRASLVCRELRSNWIKISRL